MWKKFFFLSLLFIPLSAFLQEKPGQDSKDKPKEANYILGYKEGQELKVQSYMLSYPSFLQGLLDGYSNHVPDEIEDKRSDITKTYVNWLFNKQTSTFTPEPLDTKTIDSFSYFVGIDYGKDFRQKYFDLEAASFTQGLQDALENKEAIYSDSGILDNFYDNAQHIKEETENNKSMQMVQGNELNKTLSKGITYALLKPGKNLLTPTIKSRVTIEYTLSSLDSQKNIVNLLNLQKVSINVKDLSEGARIALLHMQEGEQSLFSIPSSLLLLSDKKLIFTHTLFNVNLLSIDSFPSQSTEAPKELPSIMGEMPSSLNSSKILPKQNKKRSSTKPLKELKSSKQKKT